MSTFISRSIHVVVCTVLVCLVTAVRSEAEGLDRIRTFSPHIQRVLADATSTSPTLRTIVDRIADSNVIVYVTCEHFASVLLNGRTMLAQATAEARYLRVQVDCLLMRDSLVGILAHELQHVAEVAGAPDVVDAASFARFFSAVGYATCGRSAPERFETDRAIDVAARVRREVSGSRSLAARVVARAGSGVPAE